MGESFSAQLSTGIATFSVALAAPAARGASQPSLGLSYASSAGFGLAGLGWALATQPAIARQTSHGLPRYDDRADWHPEQDQFAFGGQELVPVCTVTATSCTGALAGEVMPSWADGWQYFRARVESMFLRFFWSPDHVTWRVQSKEGVNMEFGVPLDGTGYTGALEANPDAPSQIFRWNLARQYDAHGAPNAEPYPQPSNPLVYRYTSDGGTAYLSDIFYTSPAAAPQTTTLEQYAHHVAFSYEERSDPVTSYRTGWAVQQRLRLEHVDVASKPFAASVDAPRELLRRYHLGYDPHSHVSLLTSVQMEGRCNDPVVESPEQALPATSCPRLPAMTFEYQVPAGDTRTPLLDSQGLAFDGFSEEVVSLDNSPKYSLDQDHAALADVNSDGLPDVLVTAPESLAGQHAVYFGGAAPSGFPGFSNATKMGVAGIAGVDAGILRLTNPNVAALDVDGDGRLDLVHMPGVKKYSVFTPERTADGWRWLGRPITTASGQSPKIDFARDVRRIAVVDVNADGLVDVVASSATEMQTFFALGRYPGGDGQFGHAERTGPDTAAISNEPVTSCVPWSATPARLGDSGVSIADLNGDGLPDIVRARSGQVLYWPGRGDGHWGTGSMGSCAAGSFGQGQHVEMTNAPPFGSIDPGALSFNDVNGDGLADVVEVRFDAVDIYLNDKGTGWTDRHSLLQVPIRPNNNNPVRLTDINGSGTPDIVWGQGRNYQYVDLTGGVRPNVLVRASNGLGRTTELEYSNSARLMLDAAAAGQPWTSVMPLSVPVVTKTTMRDNLDRIGRAGGAVVLKYSYRDPVFEGRQRDFRGFRSAESRQVGDASAPTSITRTTFLLGECKIADNGYDVCSPADRWRDNWREPLRGLVATLETFDEHGVYMSTTHESYELRQLYTGRDGRRVSSAFPGGTTTFVYDTASFDAAETAQSVTDLHVNVQGVTQVEEGSVTRRASQGTARTLTQRTLDDFGNQSLGADRGCIEGCATADDTLFVHSTYLRPAGDESGWLWRLGSTYVNSTQQPAPRNQRSTIFDASGDPVESHAILSGTLPLVRSRVGGGAVAPAPPNASGGVSAPVDLTLLVLTRDTFGHVTGSRGPPARCRTFDFDPEYVDLAVGETVFVGDVGEDGCGARSLSSSVAYDRGFGTVTGASDVTGQPSQFSYDGFGRVTTITRADPANPGHLSPLPAVVFEYQLPEVGSATPFSTLRSYRQDGDSPAEDTYRESVLLIDGLGRAILSASEADRAAGDEGDYVIAGLTDYSAKGTAIREYASYFATGTLADVSPAAQAPTHYTQTRYDAFGRTVQTLGLDGKVKQLNTYRALSVDVWDAADVKPGPHGGTFFTTERDGHGRITVETSRFHVGDAIDERQTLSEYLSTGEVVRSVRRHAGSPDVVRWVRYDSLGRMVLNADPDSSPDFSPDANAPAGSLHAWRYAYDDAGDLVGTSDPRGCGVNYFLDAAGRLLAEDDSPCEAHHQAYSSPNLPAGTGVEALYRYDVADPEATTVEDAAGRSLTIESAFLPGRLVSVADRARKTVFGYDALGRGTGTAVRLAKPGEPSDVLSARYAPRWYVRQSDFDAADRLMRASTGATSGELLGAAGASEVTFAYSHNGGLSSVGSSYGTLVASRTSDAEDNLREVSLGDGAQTRRSFDYDELRRLRSIQTYRATPGLWSAAGYPAAGAQPTQQLLLEDYDFAYDDADNVTRITDYRDPEDWPSSAKPVTREYEYDDLYRLTRARYESGTGSDAWQSPYAAELSGAGNGPKPSPHVAFDQRIQEQTYKYDHLNNLIESSDDAAGFYDRSLGTQTHGSSTHGPHRLTSASNRLLAPESSRKGDLSASYDAGGNLVDLVVRRDGPCAATGASCWQRFNYEWDELGQLARARRWDLAASVPNERASNGDVGLPPPARAADVELSYTYDARGARVRKTAVDAAGNTSHDVYVFDTLELRRSWWTSTASSDPDYALTAQTEQVVLGAGGVRARVLFSQEDLPSQSSGHQHVFLEFGDYLGSTGIVIDRETGELVQYSTYQAYGSADSEFRPGRWGSFREPYRFTGKEEDVEVGLSYFGKRYLSLGLNRWISPDPVNVHYFGGGRNPYGYVNGRPTAAIDPDGGFVLAAFLGAMAVGALIGFATGTVANGVSQYISSGTVDWEQALLIGGVPGMVGGALGPVGGLAGGLGGAALGGGLGSIGSYLTTSALTHSAVTPGGLLLSGLLGAGSGMASYGIGKYLSKSMGKGAGPGPGGGGSAKGGGTGPTGTAAEEAPPPVESVEETVPQEPEPAAKPTTPKPSQPPAGPKAQITPDKGQVAAEEIPARPPEAKSNPNDPNPCGHEGGCGARQGTAAGKTFKPFEEKYFRKNLETLTGGAPPDSHAHHMFPKEFRAQFAERGINVDDPKFGTWWKGSEHLSAHGQGYNAVWDRFLNTNPGKTEILEFGREMAERYGLTIFF